MLRFAGDWLHQVQLLTVSSAALSLCRLTANLCYAVGVSLRVSHVFLPAKGRPDPALTTAQAFSCYPKYTHRCEFGVRITYGTSKHCMVFCISL